MHLEYLGTEKTSKLDSNTARKGKVIQNNMDWLHQRKKILSIVLFVIAFTIFLLSPVRRAPDARYFVLLSQTLFDLQTFSLNSYSIPLRKHPVDKKRLYPNSPSNLSSEYTNQLEVIDGKLFHYFPPGTPVLSIPLVKVLNVLGFSAVDERGKFNQREEVLMQAIIAAFLMALATALFFKMANICLSDTMSVIVALAASFGTQVWSTASRGLWSHTWGLLIVSFIIYRLLLEVEGKKGFNVAVLASLTSWLYFIRPTFAVVILCISVYVFVKNRNFIPYAAIGILWLGLFIGYSWYNFQQTLPNYYLERTFSFSNFHYSLATNLFSPSRGLLLYVPISGCILVLTIARFSRMQPRSLTILALTVIAAHLTVISLPRNWGGGNCYGSRLTTELVPWFVLLSILILRLGTNRMQRVSLCILFCLSIFVNGRGALNFETWEWNMCPEPVRLHPERIWDWKHTQFLAGISYSIESCIREDSIQNRSQPEEID